MRLEHSHVVTFRTGQDGLLLVSGWGWLQIQCGCDIGDLHSGLTAVSSVFINLHQLRIISDQLQSTDGVRILAQRAAPARSVPHVDCLLRLVTL